MSIRQPERFRQVETPPQKIPFLQTNKKKLLPRPNQTSSALKTDLSKPASETHLTEIGMCFDDIEVCLENLETWSKPHAVAKPSLMLWGLDKIFERPEVIRNSFPPHLPFSFHLVWSKSKTIALRSRSDHFCMELSCPTLLYAVDRSHRCRELCGSEAIRAVSNICSTIWRDHP